PMTSLKTSIKTITYLSDTGCLEIQGASLGAYNHAQYLEGRQQMMQWYSEYIDSLSRNRLPQFFFQKKAV
ncbi:hypothetical protein, partial [Escherichia coli]|uniref:hypothetical protein n=1 Tax=Escherichia coli TaxID=562 RepID=UPI003F66CB1D